jgi:hypothetical protein
MRPFPIDLLRPTEARLSRGWRGLKIVVGLEPFALTLDSATPIEVKTSLDLERCRLPTGDLKALAGTSHAFPSNPKRGYIAGSIFINDYDHIVDVTALRFGSLTEAGLELEIECELVLEYEGLSDYADTKWTCLTILRAA